MMEQEILSYVNSVGIFLIGVIGWLIRDKLGSINKNISGMWARLDDHNTRISRMEGKLQVPIHKTLSTIRDD